MGLEDPLESTIISFEEVLYLDFYSPYTLSPELWTRRSVDFSTKFGSLQKLVYLFFGITNSLIMSHNDNRPNLSAETNYMPETVFAIILPKIQEGFVKGTDYRSLFALVHNRPVNTLTHYSVIIVSVAGDNQHA